MNKVKINQGRYVPLTIRIAGTIGITTAIVNILTFLPESLAILSAILASIPVPVLWFSFHILTIDPEEKKIHKTVWVMGLEISNVTGYNQIHSITMRPLPKRRQAYQPEHTAVLQFDDHKELTLVHRMNKKELHEKIEAMKTKLGLIAP